MYVIYRCNYKWVKSMMGHTLRKLKSSNCWKIPVVYEEVNTSGCAVIVVTITPLCIRNHVTMSLIIFLKQHTV